MDKIVDRIKKLLALGDPKRNNSEAEVQSALLRAQRLMNQYGIEIADLEGEDPSEVVEEEIDPEFQTAATWRILIANILAKNFRTQVLKVSYRGRSIIRVVGLKRDVEATKVTYVYVLGAFEQLFKLFLKKRKQQYTLTRSDSLKLRNDYLEGFLIGMAQAFSKQVEEMALVVVPPKEVDDYIKGRHSDIKSKQAKFGERSGDQEAVFQGYQDGVSLNDKKRLGGEGDNKRMG